MSLYEKNKETKTAFAGFLKGNIINFCVAAVGLAYVFFGLLDVQQTEVSFWVTLCEGTLGIVTGLLIKQALGETGYGKGYSSPIWENEIELYNSQCNKANQYMERVDNFYAQQEIEKTKKYRKARLSGARLKYSVFFNKHGQYINTKEIISPLKAKRMKKKGTFDSETMIVLDSFQKKALNDSIKVKVYNLNLFSEYENSITSSTKKEMTDKMHKARTLGKNSVTSIVIACLGSYFTVKWVQDFDVASFVFSILQVLLWVAFGIVQLYNNYNYVVIEKVNKLKAKKELIQRFVFGCEHGQYVENPYDLIEKEVEAEEQEELTRNFSEQVILLPHSE